MKVLPHPNYPNGHVVHGKNDTHQGPAAKPGTWCPCGHVALLACQGCDGSFCFQCWWRHSHTQEVHRD